MNDRPRIVCLSGSMRFENEMRAAAVDLSLEGAIVTGPFVNMKKSDPRWATDELADPIKTALDGLHFRKIDLADEVVVVSDGSGYIGDSTRNEIAYAEKHGKPVRYVRASSPVSPVVDTTPRSPAEDATLRERIARAIQDEAPVWEQQFDAGPGVVCSVSDASFVAARLIEPELERLLFDRDAAQAAADLLVQQLEDLRDDVLGDESLLVPEIVSAAGRTVERLTAEVERLREIASAAEYVEGPADCFEQECDDFANEAGELVELPANRCSHMTVRYATADDADAAKWCPEMIRGLEAEVSRLREQLATAVVLPPESVLCDRIERAQSEWWHGENYTAAGHNEDPSNCCWCYEAADVATKTVHALLGGVSSSEAEAPALPKLKKNDGLWQQIWDALDSKNPGDVCESLLDDYTDLACAAVQGWLGEQEARSAPSEASQESSVVHKVTVAAKVDGFSYANCSACLAHTQSRNSKFVQDWADRHEADTLRPQVGGVVSGLPRSGPDTPEVFVPKGSEGRPSGSEAAEPHSGVELIAAERARQMSVEGWTPEHDAKYGSGELVRAASCYLTPPEQRQMMLLHQDRPVGWPWDSSWWKPSDDRMRDLVKAGALIAAEVDRLQRQDAASAARSEATPMVSLEELDGQVCGKTGERTLDVCDGTCSECVNDPSAATEAEPSKLQTPRVFEFGVDVEPHDVDFILDQSGDRWERGTDAKWHCYDDSLGKPLYWQRLLADFGPLTELARGVSGEAVTSPQPRVWTHGAIDNPERPAPYGQPVTLRNPKGKSWKQHYNRYYAPGAEVGGTYSDGSPRNGWGFWALLEQHGPLTEVLPEVSSSPGKEGEDRG